MDQQSKQLMKEAYERIMSLVADEKWRDAHRACLEILRFDPDNIKIIKLKSKIEKNVQKINRKAIRDDLDKLDPLWKEKRYEELLVHLRDLEPYIVDYPQLKNIILKAENGYKKQFSSQQEGYYQSEKESVKKLIEKKNYQEGLKSAEKLKTLGLHEEEMKKIINSIHKSWIQSEIEKSSALLNSEKYEDILLFYQGLLHIDANSDLVKKKIEATKKVYEKKKIEQKRETLYKNFEKMRTLFQLKKYDKALEVAQENLAIDPYNKNILKFMKHAKGKEEKAVFKELARQIKSSYRLMKEERKKNKKDFVRL
jgi:tetratricopeptide (TPR) repeat protein